MKARDEPPCDVGDDTGEREEVSVGTVVVQMSERRSVTRSAIHEGQREDSEKGGRTRPVLSRHRVHEASWARSLLVPVGGDERAAVSARSPTSAFGWGEGSERARTRCWERKTRDEPPREATAPSITR